MDLKIQKNTCPNLKIKRRVKLALFTTFKIGGEAKYFVEAKNQNEIIEAVKMAEKTGLPFFVLGGGSNVLFSDDGFEGVVIKVKSEKLKVKSGNEKSKTLFLHSETFSIENIERSFTKTELAVESGVVLNNLVSYTVAEGLTGLEWAAGIPGTVGGAIRGNTGAYNGQISDVVKNIEVMNIKNTYKKSKTLSRHPEIFSTLGENIEGSFAISEENKNCSDCQFGYRDSVFKQNPNLIILSAIIKLERGDKNQIKKKVKEVLEKRNKSLGKCYPSAGCAFKNPRTDNAELIKMFEEERKTKARDNKIPAGYLIEKLGLKGAKIGGAVIGQNNANFIINENNATARDVLDLIEIIKEKVKNEFGVEMELEIELIQNAFASWRIKNQNVMKNEK